MSDFAPPWPPSPVRPFSIQRYPSSADIHNAAGHMSDRPPLGLIRKLGAWAFVSVFADEDATCIVHLWHRRNIRPEILARVLGHELGHISDGGPKDDTLGRIPEEERAEEFAYVAAEVVAQLLSKRIVVSGRSARAGRTRGRRPRKR